MRRSEPSFDRVRDQRMRPMVGSRDGWTPGILAGSSRSNRPECLAHPGPSRTSMSRCYAELAGLHEQPQCRELQRILA